MTMYLDPRYDDVLERRYADGDDAEQMSKGHQFDYESQQWVEGHDHAHCASNDESLPLLYCATTIGSCVVARDILAELASR